MNGTKFSEKKTIYAQQFECSDCFRMQNKQKCVDKCAIGCRSWKPITEYNQVNQKLIWELRRNCIENKRNDWMLAVGLHAQYNAVPIR